MLQPSIRVTLYYLQTPDVPDRVTLDLLGRRYTLEQLLDIDEFMRAKGLHLVHTGKVTRAGRSYLRYRKITTQNQAEKYVQSLMSALFKLSGVHWSGYSTTVTRQTPTYTVTEGAIMFRPANPSIAKGIRFTMR